MASTKKQSKSTTKKPSRASAPIKKLVAMMKGIDFCLLTTQGKSRLTSRPMSNNGEVDFDGDVWFFTWRDTRKVKEIMANPQVSLSYAGGSKKEPTWIALTGTAKIVEDPAKKEELWLDELEQWFEDGPDDEDVVLIHVSAKHAEWWSYKDQGETAL